MPFIPKLPTWNTEVAVLTWNPGTETFLPGGGFTGQLYHPHRGQPGTMFGDLYLVYPKEDDIIKDPRVYDIDPWVDEPPYGDVVEFTWPTVGGSSKRYWVLQVHPRWLGFPNEHICARLRLMTATASDIVVTQPVMTWDGPGGSFATDGTCLDCDTFDDTLMDIDFISAGLWRGSSFTWPCIGVDVRWEVFFTDPAVATLRLRETISGTTVKQWIADRTGWNGTDDLTFDIDGGTGDLLRCVWPDPVILTPS